MSSNTPQHMDSIARPTSKVLAPPGGVSSNIFGTDPEPIKGNFAKILMNLEPFNIDYIIFRIRSEKSSPSNQ